MHEPSQTPAELDALDAALINRLPRELPRQARPFAVVGLELGCSEATVRSHLRQVMLKLGARRLADAVRVLHQGDALWSRAAPLPV